MVYYNKSKPIEIQKCEHLKDITIHFIIDGILRNDNTDFLNEWYKYLFKPLIDLGCNIKIYGSINRVNVMFSRNLFYKKTAYEFACVLDDDDFIPNGIDVYYNAFNEIANKYNHDYYKYQCIKIATYYF